jgi:hypothetical protein
MARKFSNWTSSPSEARETGREAMGRRLMCSMGVAAVYQRQPSGSSIKAR